MNSKKMASKRFMEGVIKYGSALSAIWLFSYPTIVNIAFSIVLSVCFIMCLTKGWICSGDRPEIKVSLKTSGIIFAVVVVLGVCFYKRWSVPDSVILVPNMIMSCESNIIGLIAVLLAAGSFLFFYRVVLQYMNCRENGALTNMLVKNQAYCYWFYIFLVSIITIALCSKSSILYPFNDAPDGNCFLTVGKALLKGKVLYKDIIEYKGPYIYFLHSIAAIIYGKTFIGVFLIEVISAFLFLCIIYKTLSLFDRDVPICIIALFAAFIFSQGGFFHGDEVEEFCLPAIALTNYYLLRYLKRHVSIKPKEMLLVGILAGCIFWSKYTICGYFACWYVYVAVHQIKEHQWDSLIKCFFTGLGGVVLSTVPVLLYFTVNKSLTSLWEVYFITNLFNYNNINTGITAPMFSVVRNIANGIWISLRYNLANCIFMLCGIFWFQSRKEKIQYIILLAVTFLFTCSGMDPQKYYTFIFAAFSAPGLLFLWSWIERVVRFNSKVASGFITCIVCAAISFSLSPNVYMLAYTRNDLPQYRFADTINSSKNATLLNYGFLDAGYYTVSDTVPSCKYFCKLNLVTPEQTEMQEYYVENGMTEFVVCRDHIIDSELYELCDSDTYFFENAFRTDYLYRLKNP